MKLYRAVPFIAEIKIMFENGQGYFYNLRYPVLLAAALKIYLPAASLLFLGLIALLIIVFFIIVGWFDLRHIRLHQTQAELSTRKYNPYFSKLTKKLKAQSF